MNRSSSITALNNLTMSADEDVRRLCEQCQNDELSETLSKIMYIVKQQTFMITRLSEQMAIIKMSAESSDAPSILKPE